jgi:NitT/TauT family transport system substrate-binding protein
MSNRRHVLGLLGGALAAPAFIRTARAQSAPLRIATIPFDVGMEVYIARELGLFAKHGFPDVTIQPIDSGAAVSAAVAGGAIDIGVSNIVTLANAFGKNIPFTIVAPGAMYSSAAPTSVLMVPINSTLKTASDLHGKIVAVNNLGALAQFAPMAWMDKNGGDSSLAKYAEMPEPQIMADLANGRVDAGLVIEPFISAARANSRVFANVFDAVAPAFMIVAHFAMIPWAKANPDLIHRFQAVIAEAAVWGNANHAKSAEMLSGVSKLSPAAISHMNRVVYAERIDLPEIQSVIDVTSKYGGIKAFAARNLILSA